MTEKKIRGVSRRDVLKGSAVATVGVAAGTMGFPAITRSQQQKRFLKPIVAGLNGKEMDPSTSVRANLKLLASASQQQIKTKEEVRK